MTSCRKCRAVFVEALYQELDPDQQQRFEEHLRSCTPCATAFAEFRSVLELMDQRLQRTPEPSFWHEYWSRLQPRLRQASSPVPRFREWQRQLAAGLRFRRTWAYRAAAAMMFVAVGIFIGRLASRGDSDIPAESAPPVVAPIASPQVSAIDRRVDRYLQRSKVLLLGLVNVDPESDDPVAVDLPRTQVISRDLVEEAGLLKQQLTSPEQQRLRRLIEDLEVILLQIANLEETYDLPAIDLVQSGVDRRAILLKINLEEMRQANRQAARTTAGSARPNPPKI